MVLLAVQFLHALAQGMAIVVLPWIVLARGAAVSSAGLVLTASFFPFILLGLPAGAAGDSGPRRRMLGWVLSAQAVVAATLLTAGPPGSLPLWAILGAAFLLGSGRVFVDAAMFGALGHLVPRDGMLSAQAAVSSAFNLGYYGGPAVGGAIIGLAGPRAALEVMVAALALGGAMSLVLRGAAATAAAPARDDRAMADGLRLVFREPTLRALAVVAFAWSVLAAGIITLAMPHLRLDLRLDGTQVSAVMACGVASMMAAPFLLHRLAGRVADTRILVAGLCGYLIPCAVFALAGGATVGALAYGPLMLANAVCAATIIGARARRTPRHLQAVAGVSGRMVVIGGFTVGSAATSALTSLVSIETVYLAIGVGMTALAAVAAPGLKRARRASRLAAQPA
ncbi:MAG: MFS transporter [Thermoleophilia bacterium]